MFRPILALMLLAVPAFAARYTEDFETKPAGPLTYLRMGDRHVSITGAEAVVDAYGPVAWGHVFLVPSNDCDPIGIRISPAVYSITLEVSSVPGKEDSPPVVYCRSIMVLPYWSMTTGPGTQFATWPADKIGKGGAGYAFLGDAVDVPVVEECTVTNGTLGKITIQTHSLKQ